MRGEGSVCQWSLRFFFDSDYASISGGLSGVQINK